MRNPYRVWDRKLRCYSNLDGWTLAPDGTLYFDGEEISNSEASAEFWTGLLDKKGKKIFVGDILQLPGGYLCWVNFRSGHGYVCEDTEGFFSFAGLDLKEIEVVGNVHILSDRWTEPIRPKFSPTQTKSTYLEKI